MLRIHQNQVLPAATSHFSSKNPTFKRLMKVYMNSSIETRFSSVPLNWYTKKHTFSERNSLYLDYGLDLLEKVSLDAINKANLTNKDIDGVVAVSSSGIATPSLDALLIDKLKLKRNTLRMPIFGLGCVGGVVGFSRASDIAIANSYYIGLMLSGAKGEEQQSAAKKVMLHFPGQNGRGAHINVSGAGVLKNAPNPDNANLLRAPSLVDKRLPFSPDSWTGMGSFTTLPKEMTTFR